MEPVRQQQRLDIAVENYSFRPNVEIDPERVKKETLARELRQGIEFDKADQIELFPNRGFTQKQLMGDVRYKISSALHDAGLAKTTYGHEVLKGVTVAQNKVIEN
jgi:hypothetical protein